METDAKQRANIQYYESPCGKLVLASVGDKLCLCDWDGMPCAERNKRRLARLHNVVFEEKTSAVLQEMAAQLDEYFSGRRKTFSMPLFPVGTDFQKRVWNALLEIPYGETRTYSEIARSIGNPRGG